MLERELSEEIVERLGIDSRTVWREFADGESGEILVYGKCNAGDETRSCPLERSASINVDTGKMLTTKCPPPWEDNFELCYWGGWGVFTGEDKE